MTSMMEVENGEEEEDLSDVVHDVPRPLDEWPPPTSLDATQKNNLNQSASRLLFLAVEYVEEPGVSNNSAFNTSFEGEAFSQLSELEQRVVSPLDPNMSCTACYSPVQYNISRPSSPFPSSHTIIVDPPSSEQVSPSSHGYLSSAQATSLSSPTHTTASLSHSPLPQPDPSLIVMGNQFSHHNSGDSYVVTSAGRMISDFQTDDNDTMTQTAREVLNDRSVLDSDKLLLGTSGLHHPSEQLVVSGSDDGSGLGLKETEAVGRVELLLSNGSIAYGIVEAESTLVSDGGGASRIIHVPREYLLAAARGQMPELSAEEDFRAIYNSLKTQGLIVEASDGGELRLVSDLEQNEQMLDPGLLDQSVLLNEDVDNMPEPMATNAEECYQIGEDGIIRSTSAEVPNESSEQTNANKTFSEQMWMQDYNKRCEDCSASLDHECTEHRVNSIISDKPIPPRSRATLPASYLVISKIHNMPDSEIVFGVFARKVIPKRTQFGPIEGVMRDREDLSEELVPNCGAALLELSIETESGEVRKLDISDEYSSNWMRFVRPAICVKEQNLILSQQGLSLYFTTTRTIYPRQELKVWYNTLYASKRKLPMLDQERDEQWPCFACDQKFKSSEELQKHLNVHEITRDENDEVTKTKKTNNYLLRRKVQSYLPPIKKYKYGEKKNKFSKNPYECIICRRAFQRSFSLKRHILQHTGDKNYSCSVCQQSFSHLYNRDRHMRKCHPKKSGSELQENKNKPKENSWQCGHCNLTFTSASVLNLHTLTHAADNLEGSEVAGVPNDITDVCFKKQNGMMGCPQCTEEFSTKKELIQHVSTHGKKHQAKDKQFRCESCSKLLASPEGLQKHSLVHEGDENKPYQCDVCKKRFTHNYGLTCHMKTHETGKMFECPICKVQFDLVLSLKNHIHTHSENGVYKCPHCNKDFEVYSLIRKHILTVHTRKHTCHYCGKNYPSLEKHMLMHSDHREFLCANCGKQFKRKDKLVEHMRRMHTEEREQQLADKVRHGLINKKTSKVTSNPNDYERFIYKCHTCLLGFKRRGMLVNHLANRHPDITPDSVPELNLPILKTTRDYYCQYCEKIYKSSSKRKAHILKNHPGLDLPMSNRQKGGIPEIPGMPNPTYSQPVGSVTTDPQGCPWCHKQYASKAKLLQHQRKKHLNLLPMAQQVPRPTTTKSHEDNGKEKAQDVSGKNAQPAVEKNGRTPVPVALSNLHSINLLQGDYEIVTSDVVATGELGENGIVIDAARLQEAAKDTASQSEKNSLSNEEHTTENNAQDKTNDDDVVEESDNVVPVPVPIALSTVHSINLLPSAPGDYEILTADGEFAENGMIIDAATLKHAVKAEVLSADLLAQTIAELGISLPDLQALSNDQYIKIIQTPNGIVAQTVGLSDAIGIHDPFFTPYTER